MHRKVAHQRFESFGLDEGSGLARSGREWVVCLGQLENSSGFEPGNSPAVRCDRASYLCCTNCVNTGCRELRALFSQSLTDFE